MEDRVEAMAGESRRGVASGGDDQEIVSKKRDQFSRVSPF